jgi:hypothetical protein
MAVPYEYGVRWLSVKSCSSFSLSRFSDERFSNLHRIVKDPHPDHPLGGQEGFFFAYALKTKHFTGPLQNGSVHLGNGNNCYVSMNHFEAATATE